MWSLSELSTERKGGEIENRKEGRRDGMEASAWYVQRERASLSISS
jgi:hypothetical protein